MTDGHQSGSPTCLTYDIDDELPSEAVVRAVAALTDTAVLDLDPLYDAIDPGRVDGLFENADARGRTEVSFEYSGCSVTVTGDEVRVYTEADDAA